jgi:hypothetical protein
MIFDGVCFAGKSSGSVGDPSDRQAMSAVISSEREALNNQTSPIPLSVHTTPAATYHRPPLCFEADAEDRMKVDDNLAA